MHIQHRKSKIFYKYLFSYAVTLLLPLVIMALLVYNYFIGITQQEVMTNSFYNLERTKTVIDAQIKQLKGISDQIYLNQNLTPFSFNQNPYAALTVMRELKNYAATNSFFSEVLLYYRGDDYLYSSTSSNSVSFFINTMYKFENWDERSFYNDINFSTLPSVRPAEKVTLSNNSEKRYVTFINPLAVDGIRPNRTLMFLVPEEALSTLLKNVLVDYEGTSAILDQDNSIITYVGNEEYLHADILKDLLPDTEEFKYKMIEFQKQNYLFSYDKSNATNWKYVAFIPTNEILKKVNTIKLVFIYVLVFILIIGSAIIYYLMNLNYKPIKKLKQYTENIWNNEKLSLNELDIVRNTIDFLNSQNSKMHRELQDNAYAAKEYLLFTLLKGQVASAEEFNSKGEIFGLRFTKPIFRVVIFNMNKLNSILEQKQLNIMKIIEGSLPEGIEGYARDHTDQNNVVLIIAGTEDLERSLESILANMQGLVKETIGQSITLGVGNAYNQITQIPKSYMEALNAIDYRLVKGIGRIIFFSEIASVPSLLDPTLHRAPEKIKLFIKQGNTQQIEFLLKNILDYLKQNNTSIFTARMICFDIVNTIVHAMDELNMEYRIPKKEYPDVFLLSKFETVDEFVEIVRKISHDICQYLTQSMENKSVSSIDRMIAYLKDNYTDCEFSIQQMADYFKMALPNLSQYFKDNTGYNILDYETNLKIEKAKELLLSSDMPLKDVAIEIGYYNVTSFIRRFKQVVGITPGEFRKHN